MSLTVEKCLQAWANSLRQMNAKADIVFFGDSLTYYGDFSSVFPDKVVCNLGLRGDTIQGMIDRVDQVSFLKPKVIYLMAGINDVDSCSAVLFKELYDSLIYSIQKKVPNTKLVIQNILPVDNVNFSISCNNYQIEKYNQIIEGLTYHYKLYMIDLFSLYIKNGHLKEEMSIDGIHLKPDDYQLWYEALKISK